MRAISSVCALACRPTQKNVAGTPYLSRTSRMRPVCGGVGPSSKVSAITLSSSSAPSGRSKQRPERVWGAGGGERGRPAFAVPEPAAVLVAAPGQRAALDGQARQLGEPLGGRPGEG